METMIEGIALHLKMLGLVNVYALGPDTLNFKGSGWKDNILDQFSTFVNFLGLGTVTITLERPLITAEYKFNPSGFAVGATAFSLGGAVLFIFLQASSDLSFDTILFSILGLISFGIFFFGISLFFIHRGMKAELIKAVKTAEKIMESRSRHYDTSLVEPGHRKMSPQNLARSAFYYRDQEQKEKSRSYFALLLELYPWTEEASAAFYELRKS